MGWHRELHIRNFLTNSSIKKTNISIKKTNSSIKKTNSSIKKTNSSIKNTNSSIKKTNSSIKKMCQRQFRSIGTWAVQKIGFYQSLLSYGSTEDSD